MDRIPSKDDLAKKFTLINKKIKEIMDQLG